VISINVVECVSDALEYFPDLYNLLEDTGSLIFYDWRYDYQQQGDCVVSNAENLHPIRITNWVMDRFLDQNENNLIVYESLFFVSRYRRSAWLLIQSSICIYITKIVFKHVFI